MNDSQTSEWNEFTKIWFSTKMNRKKETHFICTIHGIPIYKNDEIYLQLRDILFINLQYPKFMKGYDSREAFPF